MLTKYDILLLGVSVTILLSLTVVLKLSRRLDDADEDEVADIRIAIAQFSGFAILGCIYIIHLS